MDNNEHFTFIPGRRVYLLCGDKEGINRLQPIIKEVIDQKLPFEFQCSFYFSEEKKRLHETSLLQHPIGTHVYFCGPRSFLEQFTEAAKNYGYPSSSIHFERFAAPEIKDPHPFKVELTSGKIISVGEDQTLLDALLEEGIKAPYSCRTCEMKVIQGKVDHYDSFLSDEQKKSQRSILPCVSRAGSKGLMIDVE